MYTDSLQFLQLAPVSNYEVPKAAAGLSRGDELRV